MADSVGGGFPGAKKPKPTFAPDGTKTPGDEDMYVKDSVLYKGKKPATAEEGMKKSIFETAYDFTKKLRGGK